jgi:hypothetical protein
MIKVIQAMIIGVLLLMAYAMGIGIYNLQHPQHAQVVASAVPECTVVYDVDYKARAEHLQKLVDEYESIEDTNRKTIRELLDYVMRMQGR